MSLKHLQALSKGEPGPHERSRIVPALSILLLLGLLLTGLTFAGNVALGLVQRGVLRAPAVVALIVVVTFFAGQAWRGWFERQRLRMAMLRTRDALLRLRAERQRCPAE